jgi:hypothetical protein
MRLHAHHSSREGKISVTRKEVRQGEGNLCGRGRSGIDIYSDRPDPAHQKGRRLFRQRMRRRTQAAAPTSPPGKPVGAIGSHRCSNEDNYAQEVHEHCRRISNIDFIRRFAMRGATALSRASHRYTIDHGILARTSLIIESDISITILCTARNILQAKRDGSR